MSAVPDVHCAVLGFPIAHSRSPILHRAAYSALGLTDWTYERVELSGEQLAGWLAGLDKSWRGLSVTMPVKQAALACADSASELAVRLGSANTLVRTGSGWHADNTDVAGLLGALRASVSPAEPGSGTGSDGRGSGTGSDGIGSGTGSDGIGSGTGSDGTGYSSATVIGAGGTAAAAVAALAALGLAHTNVVVRNPDRARPLIVLAERLGMTGRLHPWPGTFSGESHLRTATDRTFSGESPLAADLVISTVPATATADFLGHRWLPNQTVIDVTYDPWPTVLVQAVTAAGARGIDGLAVLLWQAVGQVEMMTGQPAPVEAMRAALSAGGNLTRG